MIVEHEQQGESHAAYGKQQFQALSERLMERLGKLLDATKLLNIRQIYEFFPIRDAVCRELSWTHNRSLLRLNNEGARDWYLQEAIKQGWSVRALSRQISKLYYERLLASQDKQLVETEAEEHAQQLTESAKDYLRDPYILDFLNLDDKSYQEADLEKAIISNLQQFLLELGKGFAFVERQQRIRFYLDLVFYNFKLKCFLLNVGRFSHADADQMHMYLNYAREHWTLPDENSPVGLILAASKGEAEAQYALGGLSNQVLAAEYQTALPSESVFAEELNRTQAALAAHRRPPDDTD